MPRPSEAKENAKIVIDFWGPANMNGESDDLKETRRSEVDHSRNFESASESAFMNRRRTIG